jgi:hypothetical protein
MKFKLAQTDENFPLLRMVSEGGKWELGYVPMLFGVRVRLGRVGAYKVDCDLCCGSDPELRARVLGYILITLYSKDEAGLTAQSIRSLFPQPTVKPLDRDSIWQKKLEMFDLVLVNSFL